MAYKHHTTILPVCPSVQETNYECGIACLNTILTTLGKPISRTELLELSGTNSNGCPPVRLKKVLKEHKVSYKESHLNTITDLEKQIDNMNLCLITFQAWGTTKEFRKLEAGHYSVVFGYDKTHLYIADPGKRETEKEKYKRPYQAGVRKIRKDRFLPRWQDYDESNNKYDQWMIAVPLNQDK